MKILIASDVHGSSAYLKKLINAFETENANLLEDTRGLRECICKPPVYNTISKVLFIFKQHSPKIEFGLRRMSILSQLCRDYNMPCITDKETAGEKSCDSSLAVTFI